MQTNATQKGASVRSNTLIKRTMLRQT